MIIYFIIYYSLGYLSNAMLLGGLGLKHAIGWGESDE